mgnify:CR=1 FL=1
MADRLNQTGKFSLLLFFCLLVRLIPFRVPNVEPLTASLMPVSKSYCKFVGVFFAILSVVLYDLLTRTLGAHTFFTAGAFALLAVLAGAYFADRDASRANFVRFAIIGTLFFDASTGLVIGPLLFGQSLTAALVGQIPFTALHLLGNIVFAATLSPAIHYLLTRELKQPVTVPITSSFNPKII